MFLRKRLLIKAHKAFDELGYHPDSKNVSFDDFLPLAVKTLNHVDTMDDAIIAVKYLRFIAKKYDKITALIKKHYDFWSSIPFVGNELIKLVSDEEAIGTLFVTNFIESSFKKITISGASLEDDDAMYGLPYEKGRFCILNEKDEGYYLRYSKMDSTKMFLEDRDGNRLCDIRMANKKTLYFMNNNTEYEIVSYGKQAGLLRKEYYDSLTGDEEIDPDECLAMFKWDIIDKFRYLGITMVYLYTDDIDLELVLAIAMSFFLLYRSIARYNSALAASTTTTIIRR